MSDKTLKRLVLGQLVLLVVIGAVLVWVIVPDGVSVEWRGFARYYNPATLEMETQWWPLAVRTEGTRTPRPLRGFSTEGYGLSDGDKYWERQRQQDLEWRLEELERADRNREMEKLFDWGPDQEIQRLNDRINCLKNARDEFSFNWC